MHNLNTLPTFSVTLPVSKQQVQFRPFIMKEEKVLLMAAESDDPADIIHAIDTSVRACTSNVVSCESHSMVDVQYIFLQIRGKSVSEEMEFTLVCGNCKHATPSTLNVNNVVIDQNPAHRATIDLSDTLRVDMKYPKLKHLGLLSTRTASIEEIYRVVAECIHTVYSHDEVFDDQSTPVEDFVQFIDTLTSEQFEKLREFFVTMPKITHRINYECAKCSTSNTLTLEDIANFFV